MKKVSRKIILALSEPLPLVARPYEAAARPLGIEEGDLLSAVRSLKKKGVIRRVGAVLGHRSAGLRANALIGWRVPARHMEHAGKVMAGFNEVSHCYARCAYPHWPYNLYTMVHARSKRECRAVIRAMAEKSGMTGHKIFFTVREFKKTRSDLKEILK
jgi:DNA-binding Lrp family transcriptional regulator